MQKSTDKQLAIAKKGELAQLLKEAVTHHKHCEAARSSVANAQQVAMWHAWQTGLRLNAMKQIVQSGDWLDWLEANFCAQYEISQSTAYLYMKIDNDNVELRPKLQRVGNDKPDLKLLGQLKFDTVRKYAIGFVPDKDQPKHAGNVKFPRLASFVNIANEYNKLKYRHMEGLQAVDFNEAKEETRELFEFLRWLHSESEVNPWQLESKD
jgi:hypothetical protein